jgi:hypothetical protein
MADRMADRPPPTARQDGDRMALSVAEAAAHLGVTPDAIRARLHRGTLFGVKDSGEWRVYLDRPEEDRQAPTGERQDTDRIDPVGRQDTRQDATAPQQDTDRQTDSPGAAAVVAVYEQLVAAQREEIAFLRSELEARTDELQRRDVLLREALGRIPALAAGDDARSSPTGSVENAAPGPAGEAVSGPESDRDPHHDAIGPPAWRVAAVGHELGPDQHRESVFVAIWRRVFGRQ